MTGREKILAIAVAGLLAILAAFYVYGKVEKSFRQRNGRLVQIKQEIERKGSWSHNGHPVNTADCLKKLATRISRSFDATFDKLYDTLGQTLQEGNLICENRNGRVRWQWKDYLND